MYDTEKVVLLSSPFRPGKKAKPTIRTKVFNIVKKIKEWDGDIIYTSKSKQEAVSLGLKKIPNIDEKEIIIYRIMYGINLWMLCNIYACRSSG